MQLTLTLNEFPSVHVSTLNSLFKAIMFNFRLVSLVSVNICSLAQYFLANLEYLCLFHTQTVADPGFPRQRGHQPQRWGANLLFWSIFPENCLKTRKKMDREGVLGAHPLDPIIISNEITHQTGRK